MKASAIRAYGGIDQINIEDLPRSEPGAGEVRIRVICSSVNPFDVVRCSGKLKLVYPVDFPITLGLDVAGIVDALGTGTQAFSIGDAVFGSSTPKISGCHAEYVCLPETRIANLPSTASFSDAASLPCVALTALQSLRNKAHLKNDARVLVNGGSGGVGSVTIQIAKALGAGSVTAVSRDKNENYCRSLGADRYVDYQQQNFTQIDEQWDVIIDAAAQSDYCHCRNALTREGLYITTVPGPGVLFAKLITKLSSKTADFIIIEPNTADLETIAKMVDNGELQPQVGQEVPLSQIADAYAALQRGDHRGKITVRVAPDP